MKTIQLFRQSNPLFVHGYGFSTFSKQLDLNKSRNALRFENQNLTWTYDEFNNHSDAVANGLLDSGWKQGDRLLMLLGKSNTSESAAIFVGAAKAGVVSVPFRPKNQQELDNIIRTVNPNGIVFSPNMVFEDIKLIDAIQQLVPESKTQINGDFLRSKNYSNLKWLIHTGFYSYPGTLKFRSNLVYTSKNFNRLSKPLIDENSVALGEVQQNTVNQLSFTQLQNKYQKILTDNVENVIIAGDPQTPLGFAAVMGGLDKGYFTIFTGSDNAKKLDKVLGLYPNSTLILDGSVFEEKDLSKFNLLELANKNVQQIFITGKEENTQNFRSMFQQEAQSVESQKS